MELRHGNIFQTAKSHNQRRSITQNKTQVIQTIKN